MSYVVQVFLGVVLVEEATNNKNIRLFRRIRRIGSVKSFRFLHVFIYVFQAVHVRLVLLLFLLAYAIFYLFFAFLLVMLLFLEQRKRQEFFRPRWGKIEISKI